ncbi:MAG: leucyl aminopeptidase [Desulfobacterales bacterium]|nr:leucyl aminopeptidase [Desulfobacterales bacterium]
MIRLKKIDLEKTRVSAVIVPVCEDGPIHDDASIARLADQAMALAEFKGGAEDRVVLYAPEGVKAERAICMGLGKIASVDKETLRAMGGKAVKQAIALKLDALAIAAPLPERLALTETDILESLIEGAYLGNHRFDHYKEKPSKTPLKRMDIMVSAAQAKAHRALAHRVRTICDGTILAREWVSLPPNDKRPETLARAIVDRAAEAGLKTEILTDRALKSRKFGAMLAVGQGSESKPRLVVLRYAPKGAKKTVVLVGKGVTFDSGGINLKSSAGLANMKMDMSGAAAAAGTIIAAAGLKAKVRIIAVIPIVENMPSGSATRPGDVIRTYSGKTVEIGNTDAEGRLILADSMAFAVKAYQPDIMIDLATLTGACVVALGEKIAGVFSADDDLAQAIVDAGVRTHERCWRLPLPGDYKELLKSDLADISNMSSGRWGGAITAALFLSEFAGETRWAHIDIAGPAFASKAGPYCEAGGSGFGVRLLCELLERL